VIKTNPEITLSKTLTGWFFFWRCSSGLKFWFRPRSSVHFPLAMPNSLYTILFSTMLIDRSSCKQVFRVQSLSSNTRHLHNVFALEFRLYRTNFNATISFRQYTRNTSLFQKLMVLLIWPSNGAVHVLYSIFRATRKLFYVITNLIRLTTKFAKRKVMVKWKTVPSE